MKEKRKPTLREWQATSDEMISLRLARGQWYSVTHGLRLLAENMAKRGEAGQHSARCILDVRGQIEELTGCRQLDIQVRKDTET